jgi:hypothetical protein
VQIDWRLFKDHAAHRVFRRCNIYPCHKVSIHIQLFNYAAFDKVFQDLPAVAGSTKVVKLGAGAKTLLGNGFTNSGVQGRVIASIGDAKSPTAGAGKRGTAAPLAVSRTE